MKMMSSRWSMLLLTLLAIAVVCWSITKTGRCLSAMIDDGRGGGFGNVGGGPSAFIITLSLIDFE